MKKEIIVAIALVVALLIGAVAVFMTARKFSDQGKFVEVKGLSERIVKADRAIWSLTFEVKSNSIDDLFNQSSQNTLELIEQGIVMSNNLITYEISNINDYKSEMLAEAIANARVSAEQFADNSGAQIGDIARANQGVFDITDKDPASPEFKKVRLVSSLRYLIR